MAPDTNPTREMKLIEGSFDMPLLHQEAYSSLNDLAALQIEHKMRALKIDLGTKVYSGIGTNGDIYGLDYVLDTLDTSQKVDLQAGALTYAAPTEMLMKIQANGGQAHFIVANASAIKKYVAACQTAGLPVEMVSVEGLDRPVPAHLGVPAARTLVERPPRRPRGPRAQQPVQPDLSKVQSAAQARVPLVQPAVTQVAPPSSAPSQISIAPSPAQAIRPSPQTASQRPSTQLMPMSDLVQSVSPTVRQDAADGSATVLCTAGEGSPPSLADLGIPGSASFFDDLSADRIDRLSFTEGHNFIDYSSVDALWGRVFAVRSPWGSLAKVRTDPLDRDRLVVRWVTFERPPRPRVDMLGDWHKDQRPGAYGDALVREVTGADHYWVDLRARRHLLHDVLPNAPARYDWEKLDGPGTLVPDPSHPGDPARVRLVVDTTRFGDDASPFVGPAFRTTVQVTVEDVFGQRASAVREFRGSRRVETTRGPRRDYDPLPGGRPPMDPAPDDVRLRRGIIEALLRGYSVRRGAEEEEAEEAGAERRTGVEEAARRG